jgi:uncharacterized protein with gpF-like domain
MFTASKERKRQPPKRVVGGVMAPSAAIRIWYHNQLLNLADAVVNDYAKEIAVELKNSIVQKHFAQDATASSILKGLMARLFAKWEKVFSRSADTIAKEFVEKSDEYATFSTFNSLSTAGLDHPTRAYNSNVANTLGAAQAFNHTLITGIHQDVHERIYTAVMLSLTSPNPEEQGTSGIFNALMKTGEFAQNRAALIARDQTSKVYSSLSDERMLQNGVEEFEWLHSSAGKEPRLTHVEKDGMIFKLNDPRLWEGPKKDQGPPGWAINCRCRKRPVII